MPPAQENIEDLRSLARGAVAQQDPDTAIEILLRVVRLEPRSAKDWYGLGSLFHEIGEFERAQTALRKAISLAPKNPIWRRAYANSLRSLSNYPQALAQHRKCITDGVPDPASSWVEIARIHERMRQIPLARQAAERALEVDPNHTRALQTLGELAAQEGSSEEAERWFTRAIESTTDAASKVSPLHQLGALYEKQKRWDDAFASHEQANLWLSRTPSARDALRRNLPPFQDAFTRKDAGDFYERWAQVQFNDDLPTPLFLVGFPRSGTTMTEQVLAALPNIRTTDEHPFMNRVNDRLLGMFIREGSQDMGHLERIDALTLSQLTELRTIYWNEVWKVMSADARKATERGLRILDKHPLRILDVGLIARLFPDAKIITLVRDPRDCCLSCFFQDLGVTPVSARFLRLDTLADVYGTIMGFWLGVRDKLVNPWMEVRYEQLVADFETEARRLVEFVGEPWSDDVLRFHEKAAKRTIATPSYQAVAQKVNTRAVGKWANYERHLGPLVERLRPYLESFGYEL